MKQQIDTNSKFCIAKNNNYSHIPMYQKLKIKYCWSQMFLTFLPPRCWGG